MQRYVNHCPLLACINFIRFFVLLLYLLDQVIKKCPDKCLEYWWFWHSWQQSFILGGLLQANMVFWLLILSITLAKSWIWFDMVCVAEQLQRHGSRSLKPKCIRRHVVLCASNSWCPGLTDLCCDILPLKQVALYAGWHVKKWNTCDLCRTYISTLLAFQLNTVMFIVTTVCCSDQGYLFPKLSGYLICIKYVCFTVLWYLLQPVLIWDENCLFVWYLFSVCMAVCLTDNALILISKLMFAGPIYYLDYCFC